MTINGFKIIKDSVTFPKGYLASGIRCGIKHKGKDLALVFSKTNANVAAMFTTNRLQAAPVVISREIAQNGSARAIVINSGGANACTGDRGLNDAGKMLELTAKNLKIESGSVLVASTGVIGAFLPMDRIEQGIDAACRELAKSGGKDAAQAIMTTDTRPKYFAAEFKLDGHLCRIGAMAKGSGMINPNMATMICVVTTDVQIEGRWLKQALSDSVATTLNALTVDGEMSTNDTIFLLANGASGNDKISRKDENYQTFFSALEAVLLAITRELAMDGEGATKFVTVQVNQAASRDEARQAAKAIANSMLVKTAIFGQDPNWGRVISSVGASGVTCNPGAISIRFAETVVAENGAAIVFDEKKMKQALEKKEIPITVSLGVGDRSATVYTCDLTHEYITINADYHT